MSEPVPAEEVEGLVGARRHPTLHLGRLREGTIYVLHSADCRAEREDLRECPYSLALDRTVAEGDPRDWDAYADETVVLEVEYGVLWPVALDDHEDGSTVDAL